MTAFSKCLVACTVANALFLALDDIPVDMTWKEHLFNRIDQRIFKAIYDANMHVVIPVSLFAAASILVSAIFGTTTPPPGSLSKYVKLARATTTSTSLRSLAHTLALPGTIVLDVLRDIVKRITFSAKVTQQVWRVLLQLRGDALPIIAQYASTLPRIFARTLAARAAALPAALADAPAALYAFWHHHLGSSRDPLRRFGQAALSAFAAWQTAKFSWRVRGCTREYFLTDSQAYLRDALEYKDPPRWWFWLWMTAYECAFSPVFVGLERLQPYARKRGDKPFPGTSGAFPPLQRAGDPFVSAVPGNAAAGAALAAASNVGLPSADHEGVAEQFLPTEESVVDVAEFFEPSAGRDAAAASGGVEGVEGDEGAELGVCGSVQAEEEAKGQDVPVTVSTGVHAPVSGHTRGKYETDKRVRIKRGHHAHGQSGARQAEGHAAVAQGSVSHTAALGVATHAENVGADSTTAATSVIPTQDRVWSREAAVAEDESGSGQIDDAWAEGEVGLLEGLVPSRAQPDALERALLALKAVAARQRRHTGRADATGAIGTATCPSDNMIRGGGVGVIDAATVSRDGAVKPTQTATRMVSVGELPPELLPGLGGGGDGRLGPLHDASALAGYLATGHTPTHAQAHAHAHMPEDEAGDGRSHTPTHGIQGLCGPCARLSCPAADGTRGHPPALVLPFSPAEALPTRSLSTPLSTHTQARRAHALSQLPTMHEDEPVRTTGSSGDEGATTGEAMVASASPIVEAMRTATPSALGGAIAGAALAARHVNSTAGHARRGFRSEADAATCIHGSGEGQGEGVCAACRRYYWHAATETGYSHAHEHECCGTGRVNALSTTPAYNNTALTPYHHTHGTRTSARSESAHGTESWGACGHVGGSAGPRVRSHAHSLACDAASGWGARGFPHSVGRLSACTSYSNSSTATISAGAGAGQPRVAAAAQYPATLERTGLPLARRPLLFVGNHTITGADMSLLQWLLSKHFHLYLRGVAHKGHFNFPLWAHAMRRFGAVPGTREVCRALMDKGWSLLVYPGGGREVMKKPADDPYTLMWGTRAGFARIAIDNAAVVVPLASVGPNETLAIAAQLSFSWLYGYHKDLAATRPLSPAAAAAIEEQMLAHAARAVSSDLHEDAATVDDQVAADWRARFIARAKAAIAAELHRDSAVAVVTDAPASDAALTSSEASAPVQSGVPTPHCAHTCARLQCTHAVDDTRRSRACTDDVCYCVGQGPGAGAALVGDDGVDDSARAPKRGAGGGAGSRSVSTAPPTLRGMHKLRTDGPATGKPASDTLSPPGPTPPPHSPQPRRTKLHPDRNPGCSTDMRVTVPVVMPTPWRWQRWYFEICPPIDAAPYQCVADRDQAALHLRDRVKVSLEAGIARLRDRQKNDPDRYTLTRWMRALTGVWQKIRMILMRWMYGTPTAE